MVRVIGKKRAIDNISGDACKMASDFNGSIGPEILTVLEIKGQVLHRVRLLVKVPGWLLNLNALLPKKLPGFLPRFNEMSCGRENICFVSGSLRRILKFLRMTDCKVLWMVGKGEWNSVGFFVL